MDVPASPATEFPSGSRTHVVVGRLLVVVALATAGLLLLVVPINLAVQTHSGIVEIASVGTGASLLRLALGKPQLVQVAILAQAADMLTFVFAWQGGPAEQNPLSAWLLSGAYAVLPTAGTFPTAAAGVIMLGAKLALIAYVTMVAPHLGRYRVPVLVVCTMAGIIGAASNVIAFWPAS